MARLTANGGGGRTTGGALGTPATGAPHTGDVGESRRRPEVTAVVLTKNEEHHLPECLESLRFADSLLVLDSGSDDRTADVASAAGALVAVHPFTNYALQRQHALDLVQTEWALFIDADERVPPDLATEIQEALNDADRDGFWIARHNFFGAQAMRGGGWYPDRQLRLLRVRRSRFDPAQAVHEVAVVAGPTGDLRQPMLHLNYDSLAEFRQKQAVYTALEAGRRVARGDKVRPHNLVLQPLREFWRRYAALQGWRDGWLGFAVCAWMAWCELLTLAHVWRASR